MTKRKVVFLDRDGTINLDTGAVHSVADWRLLDGAAEALGLLQSAGFLLAVVTNQAALADGRLSESELGRIHAEMARQLAPSGVTLDAIAHCPHDREAGCGCRKPATGMMETLLQQLGPIDFPASWMVGDKESDVGFGRGIGVRTVLIRSRYWELDTLRVKPDRIVDSLLEFARQLTTDA